MKELEGVMVHSTNTLDFEHSSFAGEPIATRWSPTVKAEVKRSRLQTTNRLVVGH